MPDVKTWCVYLHRNASNGEVFYIGIGSSAKRPFSKDRSRYWKHYTRKYGFPVVEILLIGLSEFEAKKKEVELIAHYKRHHDGGTLVNITAGGDDQPMRHPEARARVSAAMRGRVYSEETRCRMSASAKLRGISLAREGYRKLLATGYNPMHAASAKAKISAFHKGRPRTEAQRSVSFRFKSKPILQYNSQGLLLAVFTNSVVAAKILSCTPENIRFAAKACCRAVGYFWAFAA